MAKQILNLMCKECHSTFKCLEKMDICIYCFIRKMNFYDEWDYDKAVEHLLDQYRMDQEFEVKCRKCRKYFKTIKRGLFNYGFVCDKCRYPDEKLKSILERLKPKEFGGIE